MGCGSEQGEGLKEIRHKLPEPSPTQEVWLFVGVDLDIDTIGLQHSVASAGAAAN